MAMNVVTAWSIYSIQGTQNSIRGGVSIGNSTGIGDTNRQSKFRKQKQHSMDMMQCINKIMIIN